MKLKYEQVFKPGDWVECQKELIFSDGTSHVKGQLLLVDEINVYFFNFNVLNYRKWQECHSIRK